MVAEVESMPAGTLGFRCDDGEVRPIDLRNVMIPPLRRAIEAGGELRLLIVAGDGFDETDRHEIWERAKSAWDLGDRYLPLLRQVAVATDVPWIRRGVGSFGWMAPGDVRVFELSEIGRAKGWLGG